MSSLSEFGSLAINGSNFIGSGIRDIYHREYAKGFKKLGIGACAAATAMSVAYFANCWSFDPYNLNRQKTRSDLFYCQHSEISDSLSETVGLSAAVKHNLLGFITGENKIGGVGLKTVTLQLNANAPDYLKKIWTLVDLPDYNCTHPVYFS